MNNNEYSTDITISVDLKKKKRRKIKLFRKIFGWSVIVVSIAIALFTTIMLFVCGIQMIGEHINLLQVIGGCLSIIISLPVGSVMVLMGGSVGASIRDWEDR